MVWSSDFGLLSALCTPGPSPVSQIWQILLALAMGAEAEDNGELAATARAQPMTAAQFLAWKQRKVPSPPFLQLESLSALYLLLPI
jgi:hypothetical protein